MAKEPAPVAALSNLYKRIEEALVPKLVDQSISCKKGCSHCCMLYTAVTTADALRMAHIVLGWPDWREWVPKLVAAAKAHCFEGVENGTYFDKRLRCVFLKEDNTCGIYSARPAPCRFHLVVSPPEKCSPDSKGKTAIVDLRKAEEYVWDLSLEMDKKLFSSETLIVAPLPLMVLFGMGALIEDPDSTEFLAAQIKDVPSPQEYFSTYVIPQIQKRSESGAA